MRVFLGWLAGSCVLVAACGSSSGPDASGNEKENGGAAGAVGAAGAPEGGASDGGAPDCYDEVSPEPPPSGVFEQARDEATGYDAFPVAVDLEACEPAIYSAALPLGSAWVLVHPADDGYCELWLGGETESPAYDGQPTQYCRFLRNACTVGVGTRGGLGGPAYLDHEACTPH